MHNAAGHGIDPIEHRSGCSAGGSPRLEGSSYHKFPLPRFRRCHTERNIASVPFPSINPVSLLQHQQRSIPARRGPAEAPPLIGAAPRRLRPRRARPHRPRPSALRRPRLRAGGDGGGRSPRCPLAPGGRRAQGGPGRLGGAFGGAGG